MVASTKDSVCSLEGHLRIDAVQSQLVFLGSLLATMPTLLPHAYTLYFNHTAGQGKEYTLTRQTGWGQYLTLPLLAM